MAPVVAAYQAMRGVAFLTAVTFVAEIGDVRRFDSPRQLMAYLGLVPSESSTGEQVRRGGITKAGNGRARRVLIEGAWTYRFPARMSRLLEERQAGLPKAVRDIAWKAQLRLCGRYRKLMARGKRQGVVTAAIAREMAAFLWAIGREVEPQPRQLISRTGSATHRRRPIRPDQHILLRIAGGRAPAGEPSRRTVWPTAVDARWQTEAAPDEHTGMR